MAKPKLILMRHGKSAWNQKNLFTGWVDIPLSEEGIRESIEGGKKFQDVPLDLVFTSTLVRSHITLVLALLHHTSGKIPVFQHLGQGRLEEWAQVYSEKAKQELLPVFTAWELNERMYGHLQGLNKSEMAQKYGADQVQLWRRSFRTAPPGGESLAMTAERTLPYFQKHIAPRVREGKSALVVAHGNSLRSIAMHLEDLSEEEVVRLELATGESLLYGYENDAFVRL